MDYDFARCSRHCATTGRALAAGERYYSVLAQEGGQLVRTDYCEEAWQGPPDGAVAWWQSEVPQSNADHKRWAPSDVMLRLFDELADDVGSRDLRYVLTLLMIRRKMFRLEESRGDEAGEEQLQVFCPQRDTHYTVPVTDPQPDRVVEIQAYLANLLVAPDRKEDTDSQQTESK